MDFRLRPPPFGAVRAERDRRGLASCADLASAGAPLGLGHVGAISSGAGSLPPLAKGSVGGLSDGYGAAGAGVGPARLRQPGFGRALSQGPLSTVGLPTTTPSASSLLPAPHTRNASLPPLPRAYASAPAAPMMDAQMPLPVAAPAAQHRSRSRRKLLEPLEKLDGADAAAVPAAAVPSALPPRRSGSFRLGATSDGGIDALLLGRTGSKPAAVGREPGLPLAPAGGGVPSATPSRQATPVLSATPRLSAREGAGGEVEVASTGSRGPRSLRRQRSSSLLRPGAISPSNVQPGLGDSVSQLPLQSPIALPPGRPGASSPSNGSQGGHSSLGRPASRQSLAATPPSVAVVPAASEHSAFPPAPRSGSTGPSPTRASAVAAAAAARAPTPAVNAHGTSPAGAMEAAASPSCGRAGSRLGTATSNARLGTATSAARLGTATGGALVSQDCADDAAGCFFQTLTPASSPPNTAPGGELPSPGRSPFLGIPGGNAPAVRAMPGGGLNLLDRSDASKALASTRGSCGGCGDASAGLGSVSGGRTGEFELRPPTAAQEDDEEERFYQAHRAELLQVLGKGNGRAMLQGRPPGGVGLLNQGATCYMNSLLQALYHTPEFRRVLYDYRFSASVHGDATRSIPLQLQRLFAEMQMSAVSAICTKPLTHACGFSARDSSEQHDVQELCRVLFDALGRSAKTLAVEIDNLFAGQVVNYIRSREAHGGKVHESRRKEQFMDLQVPIQGHRSLEEALSSFIEPEVLDGSNRWLCEELGERVDALKGVEFQTLPRILCLQMMRFVFDYATMRRRKLTDELEIPLEVDLGFLLKAAGQKGSSAPARYVLSAVCLHKGTAHGGHYHAYVRSPEAAAALAGLAERGEGYGRKNSQGASATSTADAAAGGAQASWWRCAPWRDANDSYVHLLRSEEAEALFPLRSTGAIHNSSTAASSPDAQRVLRSADAYFLVYRLADAETLVVEDIRVPEPHFSEIAAENERLRTLQRAYELHRRRLSIRVYAPVAAQLAFAGRVASRLGKLIADDEAKAAADNATDLPSILVQLPGSRSVKSVLAAVLSAFGAKAKQSSELDATSRAEAWSWARGLTAASAPMARLRRYSTWAGEPGAPLDSEASSIYEVMTSGNAGVGDVAGEASLILELGDAGNAGAGDDSCVTVPVCLWDSAKGGLSLAPGRLLALRLPAPQASEGAAPKTTVPIVDSMAASSRGSAVLSPAPRGSGGKAKLPRVQDVGAAAAEALGRSCSASKIALVVLTGNSAGKVLPTEDKAATLDSCGVTAGDVLAAELQGDGTPEHADPECLEFFERVQNTVHLAFNHPDRPEQLEENHVSISKSALVSELKEKAAEILKLDAKVLHVRKGPRAPQLKDETKTLRQAGMANADAFYVGHGSPCQPDEVLLQVSLYTCEKGVQKARPAFELAFREESTIKHLRNAIAEPLLKWAANVAKDGGASGLPSQLVGPGLEQRSWKTLRLRDGQAGKHYAVLRDERMLRNALPGLADGRTVAVQVLDKEEELAVSDLILLVRPWRVAEAKLHAPTEFVAPRAQTLAEFRAALTARFPGLLTAPSREPQGSGAAGLTDEVVPESLLARQESEPEDTTGPDDDTVPQKHPQQRELEEDQLELVVMPTVGPPLTIKRCETLKWASCPLNVQGSKACEMKLSEVTELRDGSTLVVRSRMAARNMADSAPACAPQVAGGGRGRGTAGRGAGGRGRGQPFAAAKQWPRPAERSLRIEVVCPDEPEPSTVSTAGDGGGVQHGGAGATENDALD